LHVEPELVANGSQMASPLLHATPKCANHIVWCSFCQTPASADHLVEFNLAEKLRGAFEEQAVQLQTSVGGPYMTRDEARARLNLPHLEGANDLIVPMKVTQGGQASPTDSAPPPKQLQVYEPEPPVSTNGPH
jgi:hypothetical protein